MDYLLSLQIAKRFYDTQFKIGIFENAFGVGAEQFFGLKDRWRFFTEVWDFGRKDLAPQSVLGILTDSLDCTFNFGAQLGNIQQRD